MAEKKIKNRIGQVLRERNMQQKELVEKAKPLLSQHGLKFYRSKLSQYVNHVNEPDSDMVELLADVLHVDPAWLAGFSDANEKPAPSGGDGRDSEFEEMAKAWDNATPEARQAALSVLRLQGRSHGGQG